MVIVNIEDVWFAATGCHAGVTRHKVCRSFLPSNFSRGKALKKLGSLSLSLNQAAAFFFVTRTKHPVKLRLPQHFKSFSHQRFVSRKECHTLWRTTPAAWQQVTTTSEPSSNLFLCGCHPHDLI
jgi:hypothetical protein